MKVSDPRRGILGNGARHAPGARRPRRPPLEPRPGGRRARQPRRAVIRGAFPASRFRRRVRATADLPEALAHSDTVARRGSVRVLSAAVRVDAAGTGPHGASSPRRRASSPRRSGGCRRSSSSTSRARRSPRSPGPTFADGVARGDPSAAVIADAADGVLARDLQEEFSNAQLRLYSSDDLHRRGARGRAQERRRDRRGHRGGARASARTPLAALVTRGLAEIGRIVRGERRPGADRRRARRHRRPDADLHGPRVAQPPRGRGRSGGAGRFPDVLVEMPEVAEGARTCLAVPRLAADRGDRSADRRGGRAGALRGRRPQEAVESLMTRTLRAE